MKAVIAWAMFILVPINLLISSVYFNYFDPEMNDLHQRFASHDNGGMMCGFEYSADKGMYLSTCSGGILQDRDDFIADRSLWAVGSWWDDHSGIVFDHATFQLYFYKFWE